MKDFVDDVRERAAGVDHHSRTRDVFLGLVEPDDEIALRRSRTPLVLRALVESPMQGFEIDVAFFSRFRQGNLHQTLCK